MNRDDQLKTYGGMLFWLPMTIGFLLPFVVYSIGRGFSWLMALLNQPDELVLLIVGALIDSIPFVVASISTRKDIRRGIGYNVALRNWMIRFIPSFVLYLFLLVSITVAAIKRLPGASTSSVALLFFPVIGVGLVLVGNVVIRNLQSQQSNHE